MLYRLCISKVVLILGRYKDIKSVYRVLIAFHSIFTKNANNSFKDLNDIFFFNLFVDLIGYLVNYQSTWVSSAITLILVLFFFFQTQSCDSTMRFCSFSHFCHNLENYNSYQKYQDYNFIRQTRVSST